MRIYANFHRIVLLCESDKFKRKIKNEGLNRTVLLAAQGQADTIHDPLLHFRAESSIVNVF